MKHRFYITLHAFRLHYIKCCFWTLFESKGFLLTRTVLLHAKLAFLPKSLLNCLLTPAIGRLHGPLLLFKCSEYFSLGTLYFQPPQYWNCILSKTRQKETAECSLTGDNTKVQNQVSVYGKWFLMGLVSHYKSQISRKIWKMIRKSKNDWRGLKFTNLITWSWWYCKCENKANNLLLISMLDLTKPKKLEGSK